MTLAERNGSRRTFVIERSPLAPNGVPEFLKNNPQNLPVYDELARIFVEQAPDSNRSFSLANVSPLDVNTLTQPRKTFEKIDELAGSIAREGLLMDLHIGLYDEQNALVYINTLNERWRQSHTISELKPILINGKKMYLILYDGERRLRACKILVTSGCPDHQETDGLKPCTGKHPHLSEQNGKFQVRIYLNADYDERAIGIQEGANTYDIPRPQDIALALVTVWKSRKAKNPDLTIKEFARSVGRGVETVSHAIKFIELPPEVQSLVDNKYIPYLIACQLARLKEAGDDEITLLLHANKAHSERMSVPAFTQYVNQLLTQKKVEQQMDLMSVFKELQTKSSRVAASRKVFSRQTHAAIVGASQALRFSRALVESGAVNSKNSPFTTNSNIRAMVGFAGTAQEIVGDVHNDFGLGNREQLEESLPIIIEKGTELLDVLPEDNIDTLF